MAAPQKLREPHILLASSNCRKLLKNVSYVLDQPAIQALHGEIDRNVADLISLGEEHLTFARTIPPKYWRQRVSRLYYAALNVKRAVTLHYSGDFSTDSSDHKNVGDLPPGFPDASTFGERLATLREDRNLADYSHVSREADLIIPVEDASGLVEDFHMKAVEFIKLRGASI